jgi:GT2 family glycosyltransferase
MNQPRLTVVIPVLGRYEMLKRVLSHLSRQTIDPALTETIVASDAAEPDPSQIDRVVHAFAGRTRHIRAPFPGASSARDVGWREARSELVLFLDSDVLPNPHLIAEHLAWHDRHPEREASVLGPVPWARELRVTDFMRWLDRSGLQFNAHTIRGDEGGWGHFITANISVKRRLLDLVDGFDVERFPFHYEDLEIAYRMREHGLRVLLNRAAWGEHLRAVTLEQYRSRVAGIAPAEWRFVRLHPDVEPFFFDLFSAAEALPRARGRLRHLLRFASQSTPLIGRRVWLSADHYYRQQLAPSFLHAWRALEREAPGFPRELS